MKQYLYEIYETTKLNDCNDLVIGMAMFMYDARTGQHKYGPEGVDYAAVQKDYEAYKAKDENKADRDLREFIGRHNQTLAAAFRTGDRAHFNKVVASCDEKDKEKRAEEN